METLISCLKKSPSQVNPELLKAQATSSMSCLSNVKIYVFYYITQPKHDTNNNLVKNINLNITDRKSVV